MTDKITREWLKLKYKDDFSMFAVFISSLDAKEGLPLNEMMLIHEMFLEQCYTGKIDIPKKIIADISAAVAVRIINEGHGINA